MLKLKNIKKEFEDQLILDNISLSLKKGEIVAIMGASGSGKTTLLKSIAGLSDIDSGSITFGKSLEYSKGFVSQKPSLLPWLSIRNNIAYGLKIQGKESDVIRREVNSYLKFTQLSEYEDFLPQDLSGGMKQRAALAASLITSPNVLLLDEPLSALDTQTKSHMRDFVRDILIDKKQTTILVTHDPEEALYLADRIIILSPKPARIIDEIDVPFTKERHRSLIYLEKFQDLKKYISYIMYAESVRTMTDLSTDIDKHLSIGSNIWVGTLPLYYASEKGIYEKHGIESHNLITLEWSSSNRYMPINEGLVDVLNMTLETAMIACESNPDLRILMPIDVSSGGDAIIASSEIKKIKEIRGKRVAVEKGWIGEFYLNYILRKNDLTISDIQPVYMSSKDTPKALLSGEVDVIVVQEPWLSEIVSVKNYNVLVDTSKDPIIYAAFVTTQKIINEKKELIDAFVKATQESISDVLKKPEHVVEITSHLLGVSNNSLLRQLESLTFLEESDYSSVKKCIDEIELVLLDSGMLKKPFNRTNMIF